MKSEIDFISYYVSPFTCQWRQLLTVWNQIRHLADPEGGRSSPLPVPCFMRTNYYVFIGDLRKMRDKISKANSHPLNIHVKTPFREIWTAKKKRKAGSRSKLFDTLICFYFVKFEKRICRRHFLKKIPSMQRVNWIYRQFHVQSTQ